MVTITANFTPRATNTITFVPRITIAWPAIADAVFYFKKQANLVEPNPEMDWSHTQTWLIPLCNEFCLRRLLRNLPKIYQDEVKGDAKVLKVEIFDPETHNLIGTSEVEETAA